MIKNGIRWWNMSQIRMVLADRDTLFMERFSEYLLKSKNPSFSLVLFSNGSKLQEWMDSGEKADIMAISSALYNDLDKKPDTENLILLRDCPESLLPEHFKSIFKYRPASFLMKEIISLCAEKIPHDFDPHSDSGNINLVLYADGSDALNPFAQVLAAVKAGSGRKTLYISLDEISNADAFFSGDNERGLSEMLYYIKSQKDNLALKAEACITLDMDTGVYFMKGHHHPKDVTGMNEKELSSLLTSVSGKAMYDEIIVTRGFSNDDILPFLLKSAHRVYITAFNYLTSLNRIKKICGILWEIEQKYGMDLKNRVVFCITNAVPDPGIINPDSFDYEIRYLPGPIFGSNMSFQATERYYSDLKEIIETSVQ